MLNDIDYFFFRRIDLLNLSIFFFVGKSKSRSQKEPVSDNSVAEEEPAIESEPEEEEVVIPPAPSVPLPDHVTYLIIGAGTAAFAAYRAIRSNDPEAKVCLTLFTW